jgi:hypothetical protein
MIIAKNTQKQQLYIVYMSSNNVRWPQLYLLLNITLL